MSVRNFGTYFSSSADGSANDRTIYIDVRDDLATIGAKYKNSDANHQYEAVFNAEDLVMLSDMIASIARQMKMNEHKKAFSFPRRDDARD